MRPDHAVTINRKISTSYEEVYAAYTQPEKMRGWMGEVDADVKVGGRYRIKHSDGGSAHVHTGNYELLEPSRRIVMTFRAGPEGAPPPASRPYTNEFIELRFIPLGPAETEVWLLNGWDGEDMDNAGIKALEAGWYSWLDRLENYVRS